MEAQREHAELAGTRRRGPAVILALLACGAIAASIGFAIKLRAQHRTTGTVAAAETVTASQVASAGGNNPELYRLLLAVSRRLDALEQSVGKAPATSGPTQPSSPGGEERRPTAEASAARAGRELQTFDHALKAEPVDAKWDAEFQARAHAILAAPELKGVSLDSVKCASTLCRADLGMSEDSAGDADNVLRLLSQAAPHGGMWLNRSLLGPRRAVLFVARHGKGLPPVGDDGIGG